MRIAIVFRLPFPDAFVHRPIIRATNSDCASDEWHVRLAPFLVSLNSQAYSSAAFKA
jgi:hypothetical protein